MAIKDVEEAIKHGIVVMDAYADLVASHETCTRYAIIDPILRALGWKTHDPAECEVEYQRGNQGRVDYALFNREAQEVILIEAKRLDKNSANFERQLAKYVRGMSAGVGVLTDGELWHLYDLSKRGRFESKFVNSVDIYEDNTRQAAQILNKRLSRRIWW